MSRHLFSLVLWFCVVLNPISGQVSNRVGFFLGPQVLIPGANDIGTRYEPGFRFTAGIYHEVAIGRYFSIVSEVNYSGLGTSNEYEIKPLGTTEFNQMLNYMQIPVLFRLRTGGDLLSTFVETGPYVGLLLTAKSRLRDESGVIPEVVTDIRDNFETFDWGIKAGIGFDFQPLPQHIFTLGIRFSQGLYDVQLATGLQNRSIGLHAGYVFRIQ